MSPELPTNKPLDYEILCKLLPAVELDMLECIPPERRASVPVGVFVQDETVHETTDIDFSPTATSNVSPPQALDPVLPTDHVPEELREAILALAQVCYAARANETPLQPGDAEVLAQLALAPPPLNAAGTFLKTVAAGHPVPPIPADLPPPLARILETLAGSLRA
jgi:hypothetical protein